jgi:hypothetical protein
MKWLQFKYDFRFKTMSEDIKPLTFFNRLISPSKKKKDLQQEKQDKHQKRRTITEVKQSPESDLLPTPPSNSPRKLKRKRITEGVNSLNSWCKEIVHKKNRMCSLMKTFLRL